MLDHDGRPIPIYVPPPPPDPMEPPLNAIPHDRDLADELDHLKAVVMTQGLKIQALEDIIEVLEPKADAQEERNVRLMADMVEARSGYDARIDALDARIKRLEAESVDELPAA
jgi:hypothetical protein